MSPLFGICVSNFCVTVSVIPDRNNLRKGLFWLRVSRVSVSAPWSGRHGRAAQVMMWCLPLTWLQVRKQGVQREPRTDVTLKGPLLVTYICQPDPTF